MTSLTVHRLGRVEYRDGLELQRQFQEARIEGSICDSVLLLEHPPVLTLGRGAHATNIIAPADQLAALGVETFETDRGGDVTYHGPGQLVGYPMLFLPPGKQDVRRYVRTLEEILIRTLSDFGVTATRIEKWPGVWIAESRCGGPRKIGALGVHLSRWYTKHGFALNVHPDLSHFQLIVPCGIREAGVTSISEELGRAVTLLEVEERLLIHLAAVFESELAVAPQPKRTISVAVRAGDDRVLLLQRTEARGGFWQPVTGWVESNESPQSAAQRELREETGLDVAVTPLQYEHAFALADARPPVVARETAFGVKLPAPAEVRLDPSEHQTYAWVPVEEAKARVPHAGLAKAIALTA